MKISIVLEALTGSFETDMKRANRAADKAFKDMEKQANQARKALGRLAAAGLAAFSAKAILDVTNQFQTLNAQLVTVTGTQAKANAQFKVLQEFAAKTPYQLAEVVDAFVKMKALGLDPSEKALASYGNTAAAMGKSLNQFIEAVADAATSEFERLKEFGIKARKEGEQVTFTFQGVQTTIGNNAKEITRYLQEIGNNQFAGAMERQANTLGGAWSNLQDSSAGLANAIGTVLSPSIIQLTRDISDAITETASFVEWLGKMITFDFGPLEESNRRIDDLRQRIEETTKSLEVAQADRWFDTIHDNAEAAKQYAAELVKLKAALAEEEKAQEDYIDGMRESRKAADSAAEGQEELGKETKKAGNAAREALAEWKKLQAIYDKQLMANEDAERAARQANAAVGEYVIQLQREANQAGLSQEAIGRLAVAQQIYNLATAEGVTLTAEQIAEFEAQALAAYDLGVARRQAAEMAAEAERELAEESRRAAEVSQRAWEDFTYDLVRAFEGGTEGIKDLFEQMLLDLARQLAQSGLLNMINSLFGGSVQGLAGAAAGGGQQSLLGALFNGGGGQGGGLLGSIVGGIGSIFGFGGGASTLPAFLTGSGTAFAGASVPAVAGTTAGLGSVTGGSNAAAASQGGLFGGQGFAGIPVVGWILAGMALNQSLFGDGWRVGGGSTTLPNGATVSGGGDISTLGRFVTAGPLGPEGIDRILQGIGVSSSIASLISGSSLHTRLFGRQAPVLTNGETTFGVGPDGVFGSERYRTYERGGVFRSSRRRWHDFGLSEESTEYAQGLFDFIDGVMDDAAQRLATEAPDNFRAAMRVLSEYNEDGTIKASQFFVDMFGQAFEVASEEEALQRIGAEAIIATIDGFMSNATEAVSEAVQDFGGSAGTGLGEIILRDLKTAEQTQGEAHAIAERWRHDTTLLAEGAAFLLDAASDINAGFALLGDDSSLTDIADLTEELQRSGEPLLETYQRMVAATRLLDDALELSGVTMDKTREEIVRFATGVAEAAGGIERATALWSSYFETFYSESERAALALSRGRDNAITQFADIGLDLDDFTGQGGTQAFRDLFESALPTLSEEAVVEWLEAADALGIVIELTEQYAGLLGTQADSMDFFMAGIRAQAEEFAPPATFEERISAVNDEIGKLIQRAIELGASEKDIAEIRALGQHRLNVILEEQQEAIAAAEEALRQQEQAAADLAETLAILEAQSAGGVTPLTQSLMDLRAEYESTIETINDLARASGRASASEAELAIARNWYNNQVQRLIDELFASAASLVQQFYGTTAGGLASGGGISPVASADLGGIGQVVDAVEDRYALELRLLQQLQQFIDGLTLSSLSPLTPDQRLAEAQAQYEALLAAAQGGDLDALAQLQGAAQAYMGEAQSYYGGVGAYPEIFASVLEQLGLLTGAGPQNSPASNPPQPVFGGPVTVEPGPGFAELSALDRELIATELVDVLRDIVGISQQSLVEISAQLGLDLQDLVEALGVNLQDLTVATTLQLADISRNLGVDLVELADGVGFALGDLADEQSLLNDALEQVIEGLPEDIRGRLNQLLRNIELATTEADANDAIQEAEDAINALPSDIRDLLAPFFSGVSSPTDSLLQEAYQQTSALNLIESHAGQTVLELQALNAALNQPPEPASPTATVPISAAVTASAPVASSGEVVQLRTEIAGLRRALESIDHNTRRAANELAKPQANSRRVA